MIKNIKSVRGMKDYLIIETYIFQKIEKILKKVLKSYGYNEIRLPIIENTLLFKNAIGEITDVVEKEMFTFESKKGISLTLRPEGTAGCVRACIENGIIYNQEQKLWYIGPMFRYERPQKGRYRQFCQLGVEVFGLFGPNIDVELILMTSRFWKKLGVDKYVKLHINSIGSVQSRLQYQKNLIVFLEENKGFLDQECQHRLYSNTLRILDSKNPVIKNLLKKAPKLNDYIDKKSYDHFVELCYILDKIGIKYIINHNLIRGLDYYNNTVFEWITDKIGSQNTICAGGRYDSLVEKLGGVSTPGIGFAVGIDRLSILFYKTLDINKLTKKIDLYVILCNKKIEILSIKLIEYLRNKWSTFKIVLHHKHIKNKKFLSFHNKKSRFLLVIDENSFIKEQFLLKNLDNGFKQFLSKNQLTKDLPTFLNK